MFWGIKENYEKIARSGYSVGIGIGAFRVRRSVSQFFMVQKQPAQTATPTPTQERTENLMKTNITGENEMNPIVTIEMENGMIINLELYPDKAPNTVNNFISLVKKGFYDGSHSIG